MSNDTAMCQASSHEAKSACQPLKAGARSSILRMQRAKHPRMKQKVRVSPKGWRTVFDFANAKLEKKNETAKRKVKKKIRDILFYFVVNFIFADFIPSHSAVRVTCEGAKPERRMARHEPLKRDW